MARIAEPLKKRDVERRASQWPSALKIKNIPSNCIESEQRHLEQKEEEFFSFELIRVYLLHSQRQPQVERT